MNELESQREATHNEHIAWIAMFKQIAKQFNITEKELNDKVKYKALFKSIEFWGIEFSKSMQIQGIKEPSGLFQDD